MIPISYCPQCGGQNFSKEKICLTCQSGNEYKAQLERSMHVLPVSQLIAQKFLKNITNN
jgi:hypothetical protein